MGSSRSKSAVMFSNDCKLRYAQPHQFETKDESHDAMHLAIREHNFERIMELLKVWGTKEEIFAGTDVSLLFLMLQSNYPAERLLSDANTILSTGYFNLNRLLTSDRMPLLIISLYFPYLGVEWYSMLLRHGANINICIAHNNYVVSFLDMVIQMKVDTSIERWATQNKALTEFYSEDPTIPVLMLDDSHKRSESDSRLSIDSYPKASKPLYPKGTSEFRYAAQAAPRPGAIEMLSKDKTGKTAFTPMETIPDLPRFSDESAEETSLSADSSKTLLSSRPKRVAFETI